MELFDRQKDSVGQGERTVLVNVELTSNRQQSNGIDEFRQLALSSGLNIVQTITVKRNSTEAKFFIGTGKVYSLKQIVEILQDVTNEKLNISWGNKDKIREFGG